RSPSCGRRQAASYSRRLGAAPDASSKLGRCLFEDLAVVPDVPFVTALPVRLGPNGDLLPVVPDEADDEPHAVAEIGRTVANEARLPRCHEKTGTLVADVDRIASDEHVAC